MVKKAWTLCEKPFLDDVLCASLWPLTSSIIISFESIWPLYPWIESSFKKNASCLCSISESRFLSYYTLFSKSSTKVRINSLVRIASCYLWIKCFLLFLKFFIENSSKLQQMLLFCIFHSCFAQMFIAFLRKYAKQFHYNSKLNAKKIKIRISKWIHVLKYYSGYFKIETWTGFSIKKV